MRMRLRTDWLEIASGFHLLFAAVAVYALPSGAARLGAWALPRDPAATLMVFAACTVFLLHPLQASRPARRFLFLLAAVLAAAGATWFMAAGSLGLGVLQIGYALWFAAASFLPWCDRRVSAIGEPGIGTLGLIAGAGLASIGIVALVGRGGLLWHAGTPLSISVAILTCAVGLALCYTQLRGTPRARLATTILAAVAVLYHGLTAMTAGDAGTGGAFLAVGAILLLSVALDARLPEAADDLSGVTLHQREIYDDERIGETMLWLMTALLSAVANFTAVLDVRMYFAALLLVAIGGLFSYRLRPASKISEVRYLLMLSIVVTASILLIAATGGVLGPLVPVAYLAVFAGTAVIRPTWSIAFSAAYAAYVTFEFIQHVIRHPEGGPAGHPVRYVFLAVTLIITGLYAAWTSSRRIRKDEALFGANRRLAEGLRNAIRERELYERQTQDLKSLNQNLMEMRSALMNVLEDVEQSKRQIEAERRREVASFDALAEGVVAAGKDGRIFLCNPTAARILGVLAETVIGQPIERVLRLFGEEGPVLQTRAFEDAYAGRSVALGERLRLSRADGSHVPVSGTVAPYFDEVNHATGVVAAFRDVTVEREIDRQKSDFISIASHQLRTPLSALRWFLDLFLAGDVGPLKPTQKEYLGDMSTSVERMIRLVGDLLNVSRIESGRTKPNPENIETRAFVASLAREFAPLVAQQQVVFTSSVAKDAVSFYADLSLAHQAIANVISNAVKYTPSGGSVSLDVVVKDRETVFTVTDTGLGIPKAQQYRIYDKFFRGENVVAKETVGSGLGLYVVKTIVDISGGRVWFESMENKGAIFHVSFPNRPAALPSGDGGGTLAA